MPSLLISGLVTLLSASSALAADWDWDWEQKMRIWREASLDWASDIHPQHPSPLLLLMTTAPPPREIWCETDGSPTLEDIQQFESLLSDWSHTYLSIPVNQPLPSTVMATFPAEC